MLLDAGVDRGGIGIDGRNGVLQAFALGFQASQAGLQGLLAGPQLLPLGLDQVKLAPSLAQRLGDRVATGPDRAGMIRRKRCFVDAMAQGIAASFPVGKLFAQLRQFGPLRLELTLAARQLIPEPGKFLTLAHLHLALIGDQRAGLLDAQFTVGTLLRARAFGA